MLRRSLPVAVIVVLSLGIAPLLNWKNVYSAPGLANRSLTTSNSNSSSLSDYAFQFDLVRNGVLGSIQFEFCSNNPIAFTVCNAPSGLDVSTAVLSNQTGEVGFVIAPGATSNNLLLTRIPAAQTQQTVTYTFSSITNPDTPGSYYVRLITYSTVDGSGVSLEEAGIAYAIDERFAVSAYVPPFLQFCVGISITGTDCNTATGSLIDFGILSDSYPSLASSQMVGATNGFGGLSIIVTGTTMTSGINTIDELSILSPSIVGTSQFGINLRANNNPAGGSNPAGLGTTTPTFNYNQTNQFYFSSGDTIAWSPLSTDFNNLTVTYLVNIDPNQNPGVYTATLTYIATATF